MSPLGQRWRVAGLRHRNKQRLALIMEDTSPTHATTPAPRLSPRQRLRRWSRRKKSILGALTGIFVLTASIITNAFLTNPFGPFPTVRTPYRARFEGDKIVVTDHSDQIHVCSNLACRGDGFAKSALYMIDSRYFHSPKSKSTTVDGIAQDIHTLRFNPENPYIISGDHFTPFYNRSLGIFYYSTLDPSIKTSDADWRNRELSYLQTFAFALSVYDKSKELSTTIVPMGGSTFTPIDVYAYPSDTMYSLLYAGAVLSGVEPAYSPFETAPLYPLRTQEAAKALLARYNGSIKQHLKEYRDKVYDPQTGLIRSDIHLSGTKDITRRENAFYDNVIYWRTLQLAQKLGLITLDKTFLDTYKQRILTTFWLPNEGHFLEDRSAASLANHYYSSDWLIVLATRFLDPSKATERPYFTRSIAYIEQTNIAEPFGVKYQNDRRKSRQFAPLRLFGTASYGGDSIWSFWGLEYIKTLLVLYKNTNDTAYLTEADRNIAAYKQEMLTYGGFPELYDARGKMYQTPVYRSVRQTGWVIGFEQALTARNTLTTP